jgi:hypothetical protein
VAGLINLNRRRGGLPNRPLRESLRIPAGTPTGSDRGGPVIFRLMFSRRRSSRFPREDALAFQQMIAKAQIRHRDQTGVALGR